MLSPSMRLAGMPVQWTWGGRGVVDMAGATFGKTYPSLDAARRLVERGNLIPVYREVLADTETPVSVYRKIARGPYSFLLEALEVGSAWRATPLSAPSLDSRPRCVTARPRGGGGGETTEHSFANPLELIKGLLAPYRPVPLPDMPRSRVVRWATWRRVRTVLRAFARAGAGRPGVSPMPC